MNTPEKLRRVDELTDDNFKRVLDVVLDIHKQLNLATSPTVTVAVAPQAVKFGLLPNASRPALDEYEEGRKQACAFLKDVGVIADHRTLNPDGQRVWRKFEVTVNREAFDKVLAMLQSRRSRLAQYKTVAATRPEYDADNNVLRYGTKSLTIRDNTIQHFTCKLTFENLGKRVAELDIISEFDEAKGNEDADARGRIVYDACRALNKKVEAELGLSGLFAYDSAKVWVNMTPFTDD